jgi:hypothetical protein
VDAAILQGSQGSRFQGGLYGFSDVVGQTVDPRLSHFEQRTGRIPSMPL